MEELWLLIIGEKLKMNILTQIKFQSTVLFLICSDNLISQKGR